MMKTLVIYSSKYGTTREVAKTIALVTGPAKCCSVEEFKPEYAEFDFVVIGSPIYQEKLDPSVIEFVEDNREWLREKPVSLFCTCLDSTSGLRILTDLKEFIKGEVLSLKAVGGRLIIDDLDGEDYTHIKEFLNKVKLPFEDMNFYNLEEIVNYSLKLKYLKDTLINRLDETELKGAMEEFLTGHNTCTLATSHGDRVRTTPIEYSYSEGYIYLLSEGGEKFANLLLNENVSVSVYDDYTNMNSLGGMQITGRASIVEMDSEEYVRVLEMKGVNIDTIKTLVVDLNMIKISIDKAEFLNSKFNLNGYGVKQIYNF